MRPDCILLSELRSDEAYYCLRTLNSGHARSIARVHASSTMLASEQLTLLVKESLGGRDAAIFFRGPGDSRATPPARC